MAAEHAKEQAEKQVAELRAALDDREQQMKARTDALEAQYTQEKHMLLLKAENERQSAVLAVKAEYAARIESLQEKYMAKYMAKMEASYGVSGAGSRNVQPVQREKEEAEDAAVKEASGNPAGKEADAGEHRLAGEHIAAHELRPAAGGEPGIIFFCRCC